MDKMNRFEIMLEALAELQPEIDAMTRQNQLAPAMQPINDILTGFGPMPSEALFLGVASDGLPLLLNMHDPVPGPILITGDSGAGKTLLLQTVATAAGKMHRPQELQFGAMTNHPEEWIAIQQIPNNVGIFPFYHRSSEDFVLSLASWAHGNRTSKQSILLFLDDLDAINSLDHEARQNLRWLFLRGPARRVWPIVTLDPDRMDSITQWLEFFHTRIFGKITNKKHICTLDAQNAEFDSLNAGTQFTLREGNDWLRFWIPSIK